MSHFLDYATPRPRQWDVVKRIVGSLPLSLGLLGYAFICIPAVVQQGDWLKYFFWTGVTHLWIFPVPLFVLWWPGGRFSKIVLVIYALASGYVDSGTILRVLPPPKAFIAGIPNSYLMIPLHLVGVGVIAWISRFAFAGLRLDAEARMTAGRQNAADVKSKRTHPWIAI